MLHTGGHAEEESAAAAAGAPPFTTAGGCLAVEVARDYVLYAFDARGDCCVIGAGACSMSGVTMYSGQRHTPGVHVLVFFCADL